MVTAAQAALAFYSWFYGLRPSGGLGGWYSAMGTFTTPATPCY